MGLLRMPWGHLEDRAAPVVAGIIESSRLPGPPSDQHFCLMQFLALQMMRTAVAVDKVSEVMDKTRANLLSSYGRISPRLDEQLSLRPYEAARIALGHFDQVFECFSGLHCRLLVNRTARFFVTSDNPAFKYNLYCEGVQGHGILGAAQSGFMLFVPLSPRHVVLLHDA
jgi:Protein of unknown function (DUF4238)